MYLAYSRHASEATRRGRRQTLIRLARGEETVGNPVGTADTALPRASVRPLRRRSARLVRGTHVASSWATCHDCTSRGLVCPPLNIIEHTSCRRTTDMKLGQAVATTASPTLDWKKTVSTTGSAHCRATRLPTLLALSFNLCIRHLHLHHRTELPLATCAPALASLSTATRYLRVSPLSRRSPRAFVASPRPSHPPPPPPAPPPLPRCGRRCPASSTPSPPACTYR